MKKFFATLTLTLLLAAVVSVNAQEAEQKPEKRPEKPMPMKGGEMKGQMEGGMRCPMCGQIMPAGMMGQMMGGQPGMMGQKPMMDDKMRGSGMERERMRGQLQAEVIPSPQTLLAFSAELKMDDEQVKSLKQIALNVHKESIRKKADREIAEVELHALLEQEPVEIEQAQQKIRQVANIEAELKITHIQASIAAKKVLTADQRALLQKIATKEMRGEKASPPPKGEKVEKPKRPEAEHEAHHP